MPDTLFWEFVMCPCDGKLRWFENMRKETWQTQSWKIHLSKIKRKASKPIYELCNGMNMAKSD